MCNEIDFLKSHRNCIPCDIINTPNHELSKIRYSCPLSSLYDSRDVVKTQLCTSGYPNKTLNDEILLISQMNI